MRTQFRTLALLVVLALIVAACGGDGGETGTTTPPQPTQLSVTATASGRQVTLEVPAQIKPGATQLTLANNTKEPVELQLLRLDEGHSLDQFLPVVEKEGAPIPTWAHGAGGIGATPPNAQGAAVLNLQPGRYDFFSNASETQPGAQPQYDRGAKGSFEVTGESTGATLPKPGGQITARDYTFETSGLKPGTNPVTFTNAGGQLHHVVMAPINKGSSFEDAQKFLTTENFKGKPPVDFSKSDNSAVLDGQGTQVETFTLQPGTYVFACFINDRAGGPPHAIKYKMIKEVTVPQG
jgi:plastocyanin